MRILARSIGSTYPTHGMDPDTVASISRAMQRKEMTEKADIIAAPMRKLLEMLNQGEVFELDGQAVMHLPSIDEEFGERAEWVPIAPAIAGWIDCWKRLAPDLEFYHLGILGERLREDKPITPRLVEKAQAEFERTVNRIADLPPGKIASAIRTTEIAWEVEKMMSVEACE